MDLESVADELYAASPDEFVERRKQRADEARAAKDRPLVKAIGQLRRPTRSAWMVNLLSQQSPTEVQTLLALGAALGEAQQRASGPDLRRLSRERQTTLDALTRRATELAAARDHTATEATRQEVSQTLQAALADPAVAELVRTGRVIQPATYGGFGPMLFGPPAAPDAPAPDTDSVAAAATEEPVTEEPATEEPSAEDPAVLRAREAIQAAEDALDAARTASTEAAAEADRTTAHADELAERVEALRGQLQAAEEAEREAGTGARAARKEHQARQQDESTATRALVEAQTALAELAGEPGPPPAADS